LSLLAPPAGSRPEGVKFGLIGASAWARGLLEAARNRQSERNDMAAEGDDKELLVHRRGYESFISMFRMGAAICLVIGFIVILLIRK
jgi:hypothetical protein